MPYTLRKVPKKDLYWVVNKETGKKHSKEGLPKETAEAQRRALYAAESGYVMKGKGIEMNLMQQMAQSAYRGKTKLQIGPFKLLTSTPTLKFYKDDKRIVIAVRGTELSDKADLTADGLAVLGMLRNSERWKKDEAKIREVQEKFPPSEYRYIAVGHSLGGAIIDLMLRDNLIKTALSYNPLVEPQELGGNPKHRRIYHKDDPLYQTFGRFIPNVEVRTTAEPFWKYFLQYKLPFGLGELFKLYDRHRIARFRGGALVGGMTFNDFRRWWVTPINDNDRQRLELTGNYDPRASTRGDVVINTLTTLLGWGGTGYGLSVYDRNETNTGVHPAAAPIAFTGFVGSPFVGPLINRLIRLLPMPPTERQERELAETRRTEEERRRGATIRDNPMLITERTAADVERRQIEANRLATAREYGVRNPMRSTMRAVLPPQATIGDVEIEMTPQRLAEARAAQEAALEEETEPSRIRRGTRVEFAPTMTGEEGAIASRVLGPEDFEDESDVENDVGNDRDGDGKEDEREFTAGGREVDEDEEEFYKNMFKYLEEMEEEEKEEEEEEEEDETADSTLTFEDQLKELDYPPKKYLAKVKAKAKKAGYDPKKLSFCIDGIHKLQYETPDGKMVHFGRVGYGDFLIWSFLERNGKVDKGEAKKRRKLYLKRSSAIKGDWKDNKHSPNNLAMKILW